MSLLLVKNIKILSMRFRNYSSPLRKLVLLVHRGFKQVVRDPSVQLLRIIQKIVSILIINNELKLQIRNIL